LPRAKFSFSDSTIISTNWTPMTTSPSLTFHTSSPTSYFLAFSIPTSVEYIVVFSGWVVALFKDTLIGYYYARVIPFAYHL